MKRTLPIIAGIVISNTVVATLTMLCTCVAPARASAMQGSTKAGASAAPHALTLRTELRPGDVLRYELEGSVSFLPQADAQDAAITPAHGPCDYSLAAIVTLRPQSADKDGNTPVQASYSDTRVTSVRCPAVSQAEFEKRLAAVQLAPVIFRVGPHGETGLIHFQAKYFDYWNGGDLLRKLTLDLLQTKYSSQPVSPGTSWKPRGQFAYSRDYGLHQLELSAGNIKFRDVVDLAGKSCAWINSKYIFSPLDVPASATTREGSILPGAGNNAVAATLEISVLLDIAAKKVAWVHRSQTIDNRLTVASSYPEAEDPDPATGDPEDNEPDADPGTGMPDARGENSRHPFMSFHFHEDGWARLLPQGSSMEWLAALRSFEATPEPAVAGNTRIPASPGPLAQAAKPEVLKKTTRVVVDSDSLLATPTGFTRYEKALCRDSWFCATVSVALPGNVEVSDDTALRSVYLARKNDVLVSVAVGPALDRKYRGLTEEEELQRHAKNFLSNYVWMAVKPGIGTSSAPATLDGYPGMITDFKATQRDLADMHGVLGLILTPWGKVVPLSCTSDNASLTEVQALCDQIITSVSLRR